MRVLATDLLPARLKLAKKLGAHRVCLANKMNADVGQFDAAVLAVPSDAALQQALQFLRGAGQVLLFAHTKRGAKTELDLASVCVDEKDLIGSYSADVTIQKEVARLVFSRQLDVRKLISHRFPLEQTADAVALAAKPTVDSLKVMVTVDFL
jgi:L-iditol 2-dehydrogenase